MIWEPQSMTQTWPGPLAMIHPPPPTHTPQITGLETDCPDLQAKTPGMMMMMMVRGEEAAKVCFKGQGGVGVCTIGSTRFIDGG